MNLNAPPLRVVELTELPPPCSATQAPATGDPWASSIVPWMDPVTPARQGRSAKTAKTGKTRKRHRLNNIKFSSIGLARTIPCKGMPLNDSGLFCFVGRACGHNDALLKIKLKNP